MKQTILYLLFFLLSTSFSLNAQVKVQGKVTDSKTQASLPFATIGIKNKGVGTVTDENGQFNFEIPADSVGKNDNLIISSVGYKQTEVGILDFSRGFQTITLTPAVVALNEVTVRPIKFKTKVFGRTGRSAIMSTRMITERNHVSDDLGKEIGTVLDIDKDCQLKDFNLFVIFNHFKFVKFRLNIYSVKNDLPDTLLINDNITFDVQQGRQTWVNVDLTKYNIYLKDTDKIAVTIQWLKSETGDDPKKSFNVAAVPSSSKSILFRDKSQSQWLKVGGNLSFNVTADCF